MINGDDICIVCINPAFANAATLQKALDCKIVAEKPEPKGFHKICTKPVGNIANIPEAKHYIFAGSGILLRIDASKLKGRKSVIISDSHYLEYTDEIDKIIEDNDMEVSCMIDLWDVCKHEKRAYFQPFEQFDVDNTKSDTLTVCHSPSVKVKTNQKGSAQIESVVKDIQSENRVGDIEYVCITNETWSGTIKRKASAQIFVDQLVMKNHYDSKGYRGGIGKSGLEGMLLKCLTISSGNPIETDVPAPPYVVANSSGELYMKMCYYLESPNVRSRMIERQYEWAKKYTSLENVAQRILKDKSEL
jgi:hypothetical protein